MVRRTVIEYARAGGAGLHLEDQKFPKRCGHLDGKELVSTDHMIEKVEWAASAAAELGNGFVVCARTDARGVDGFEAAVDRAAAYTLAGADMIFPEGLATESEFERFAAAMRNVKTPGRTLHPRGGPFLLANMTEFGKTPMIPLARFEEMGYSCVIFPVTLLRIAMGAVTRALVTLQRDGSAAGLLETMQTRQELYELIGYKPGTPWNYPVR